MAMGKKLKRDPGFYWCEHWQMNYYFFLGWPWNEFVEYVQKHWDKTFEPNIGPTGKTVQIDGPNGKCRFAIWTSKKRDYPVLAHECLHAANWTLGRAGWQPNLFNDEPQAYLMMNILRQAIR